MPKASPYEVLGALGGVSALIVVVGSVPRAFLVRTAVSLGLKQITRTPKHEALTPGRSVEK